MSLNRTQLQLALRLRNVQRFQTHRMQHKQQVDQHSFRAAMLYDYFGGTDLLAMLLHDLEEAVSGDLPSPIKKFLTGMELFERVRVDFSDAKQKKLGKMCDKLELVLDLREQLEDTGKLPEKLMTIYEDEKDKVMEIAKELHKEKEVIQLIKTAGKPIIIEDLAEALQKLPEVK